MIRTPPAPKAGDPISAEFNREILRIQKAITIRPSARVRVSHFRGGTLVEVKRR